MREIFPPSFIPYPNLSLLTAMVRVTDHVPALGVVAQALQLLRGSVTFAGQESNTFLEDLKRLSLLAG